MKFTSARRDECGVERLAAVCCVDCSTEVRSAEVGIPVVKWPSKFNLKWYGWFIRNSTFFWHYFAGEIDKPKYLIICAPKHHLIYRGLLPKLPRPQPFTARISQLQPTKMRHGTVLSPSGIQGTHRSQSTSSSATDRWDHRGRNRPKLPTPPPPFPNPPPHKPPMQRMRIGHMRG